MHLVTPGSVATKPRFPVVSGWQPICCLHPEPSVGPLAMVQVSHQEWAPYFWLRKKKVMWQTDPTKWQNSIQTSTEKVDFVGSVFYKYQIRLHWTWETVFQEGSAKRETMWPIWTNLPDININWGASWCLGARIQSTAWGQRTSQQSRPDEALSFHT